MSPPPAGWRPVHVVEPAAPRALPPQQHALIDTEEERARALTRIFGLATGAIILVLLAVVCGRAIFS